MQILRAFAPLLALAFRALLAWAGWSVKRALVSKDEHHAVVMLARRRQSRDRARGQCGA